LQTCRKGLKLHPKTLNLTLSSSINTLPGVCPGVHTPQVLGYGCYGDRVAGGLERGLMGLGVEVGGGKCSLCKHDVRGLS